METQNTVVEIAHCEKHKAHLHCWPRAQVAGQTERVSLGGASGQAPQFTSRTRRRTWCQKQALLLPHVGGMGVPETETHPELVAMRWLKDHERPEESSDPEQWQPPEGKQRSGLSAQGKNQVV